MKNTIWTIVFNLIITLMISGLVYIYKFSMDVVETVEINDRNLEDKLLIATQGSYYKNIVTKRIVDNFKNENVYIKIIDATYIGDEQASDYNAIVIMCSWEIRKPPTEVVDFMDNIDNTDNINVLSTSGGGDLMIEGVDGITSASVLSNIPDHVQHMTLWIQSKIN